MKKWVYIVLIVVIIILAILVGNYFYKTINKREYDTEPIKNIVNATIEENTIIDNTTVEVDVKEEKVSPNATLVLEKHYAECNHTIKEYAEIPEELVNLTKEEIEKEYPDWKVSNFNSSEITLTKEEEGFCNQHYLLKEVDGVIAVYKINEQGEEELEETTGIYTQYLADDDRIELQNGIKVFGKEKLNSILEDYE